MRKVNIPEIRRPIKTAMKLFLLVLIAAVFTTSCYRDSVYVYYNFITPQHEFAANDIKVALEAKGYSVEMRDLSLLTESYEGKKVVIALADNLKVRSLLNDQGVKSFASLSEQAYALRTIAKPDMSYWVLGGDDNGAMYGALQIAENIDFKGFDAEYTENESPYIENRGIKFNIPLDVKAPTYFYNSLGTANQIAIKHVWDSTFWFTWFDEMARHRYNVLTLWNPHAYTSMLNMEDEYPGIAIQGVTGFDEEGNEVQINDWSIDEKVAFWQRMMKYGHDRGFDIFLFNWNIFLSTAEDKYGITEDPENEDTKTYLNKGTKKLLETYPLLAGLGLTVGENLDMESVVLKEE